MNLNYVKMEEDQAILDIAYNAFLNSLAKATKQFVKDLVWIKVQKEPDSAELVYTAGKAKELIATIDSQKINKTLYIGRVSNSDQISAWIQNGIIVPIFGTLGLRISDTCVDRFDLDKDNETRSNWDNLRLVMYDLYRKSIEQDRVDTENKIESNKKLFDSIFETDGDE